MIEILLDDIIESEKDFVVGKQMDSDQTDLEMGPEERQQKTNETFVFSKIRISILKFPYFRMRIDIIEFSEHPSLYI